jgi:hypothetical protein
MRAKVAVVTLRGKAYFLIVNELKRRKIPFISLFPGAPVNAEISAAITTRQEAPLVSHRTVIVYDPESDPEILGQQVVMALRGKKIYEHVIIGVDPGEVHGVAVIADGTMVDSENCFSAKEAITKIKSVLRSVDPQKSLVTIKIGRGVPVYSELLEALDEVLPRQVLIEIVGEAGTNSNVGEAQHGRGFRHIVSAVRIAGRSGVVHSRRCTIEQEG